MTKQLPDPGDPKIRATGIGASDAATIVGLNRRKDPLKLYLEKRGLWEPTDAPDPDFFEPAYWGNELEPVVLREHAKRNQVTVLGRHPIFQVAIWHPDGGVQDARDTNIDIHQLLGTLRHPEHEWMLCHLDGWELEPDLTPVRPVQAKTAGHFAAKEWGDEGTDETPAEYVIQEQHEALIVEVLFGIRLAIPVPVLFAGQRFATYEVAPDLELQQDVLALEQEFWDRVQRGDPPPAEPTEAGKRALNHLYPKDTRGEMATNEHIDAFARRLKEETARAAFVKQEQLRYQNAIKEEMKEHGLVRTAHGKIHWRNNKDSEITNWEQAYRDLWLAVGLGQDFAPGDDLVIIRNNTKVQPGPRVFRFFPTKED